ncbi:MAG: hypothetical protein Kow0042_03660 [Calditrichia bacterium]
MKKSRILSFAIISMILLALTMGCSNQSTTPLSPIPPISQSNPEAVSFEKGGPNQSQLADSAIINPDDGGNLKIFGRNINNASFKIKKNSVFTPILMKLSKANEVCNIYKFEPLGMVLAQDVEIEIEYGNSPLPYGVNENDLQIFKDDNGVYTPLTSQVNKGRMIVFATTPTTGIYFLGAYDENGQLQKIEGEYGVRREKRINWRKGGKVSLGLGSYVEVPPYALNENTTIGIIATRETIQGISDAKAFAFTPHGTVFNVPVKLVLAWREMAGQTVQLWYDNPLTGQWELTNEGVWDLETCTVTLEIPHFSRYALAISR